MFERKKSIKHGGSLRFGSTIKGNLKTTDQSIATRYKQVSLFSWYPPQKISETKNYVD